MSIYSIPVSGPDPRLAMLRALTVKSRAHLTRIWTTLRIGLGRATRFARATASTALAALGHPAGYHAVRYSLRTVSTTAVGLLRRGFELLGRGLRALGRLAHDGLAAVAPGVADTVASTLGRVITAPARTVTRTALAWIADAGQLLWSLSGTSLVRTITTRTAQAASIVLGIHTLTHGAVSARIVQALPWAMDAIVTMTNPAWALAAVGIAFTTAMALAALRVLRHPSLDPDPDELQSPGGLDLATPNLPTGPRRLSAEQDYRPLIASLNIEITPDGTVLVHGIPDHIPVDLGAQLAEIAADAATARLERILLHRAVPTRDDRRLLTKVARDAVRVHTRRLTQQHASA